MFITKRKSTSFLRALFKLLKSVKMTATNQAKTENHKIPYGSFPPPRDKILFKNRLYPHTSTQNWLEPQSRHSLNKDEDCF